MPAPRHVLVQGTRIPTLLYGTAWKEDRTEALVREALHAGFRGVDTANQRKHYHEAGVGAAVRAAFAEGLRREDIFLQTKFTHVRGQDHRLPYDPRAPVATQVAQSCASSLKHLGVDHLDAYLLHGPSTMHGVAEADLEAWGAMEDLQRDGKARLIGVSNVSAAQLQALHEGATMKPSLVQNRTFVYPHADAETRAFCAAHGIAYEGFSLLTAIPRALLHPAVGRVGAVHGQTPAQVILRWCIARGIIVLTGTTSTTHMAQDLSIEDVDLTTDELATLDQLLGP